jgi:hypothetical protein
LRAEANPMTLMTDPTTGQLGFYPKGGFQAPSQPAGPQTKQIGNTTYYLVNGEWYDNPEGH